MILSAETATVGCFVGRVWRPELEGPSVVSVRGGRIFDVTSPRVPSMRDLLEFDRPAEFASQMPGVDLGPIDEIATRSLEARCDQRVTHLLAPSDLQAIKACGVTFARSMIERVIEERAAGDPLRAQSIRARVEASVGTRLADLRPGSSAAAAAKAALIEEGIWSQYLEVGIGPDAEIFTKAQPMSAVGYGADVGLLAQSRWNNPEPEMVLAVDSRGRIKGATLGNDVNLRDVEGRSALLLGKAKDNNASTAIGPFIRLFDGQFGLDDVRNAEIGLYVAGSDGFELSGRSSMREISRDPGELVAQAIGPDHQYPDGLMLFLGTMFAPVKDRDRPGEGFTHHIGDVVTISTPGLGSLINRVILASDCPSWTFGAAALMRNLAVRGLLAAG